MITFVTLFILTHLYVAYYPLPHDEPVVSIIRLCIRIYGGNSVRTDGTYFLISEQ